MRRFLRFFLPFPILALGACSAQGVRDIPRCPPCPCLRDLGEARDLAARPDLAAPADLSALPDLLRCSPAGGLCADAACCAGLVCVGGLCIAPPAR